MDELPVIDLAGVQRELALSGRRVKVLWQRPGSLAFVARGREYRSEFHVNASDEFTLMLKGTMHLHHRTPEGTEQVCVIPEGSTSWMPGNTPHSPRFPPDAFALITERGRHDGEVDRFQWYCPQCDALLHEEAAVVEDYRNDYVTQAYRRFFGSEAHRTCRQCSHVMAVSEGV